MSPANGNTSVGPTGTPFVLGSGPFATPDQGPIGIEFDSSVPEDRLQSWPMVYVLSNDAEAYVGQTTSVHRRMSQHGANPEKQAFTQVNVIYNEEFNASVVTDYEHRMIDLMQGDGHFKLTNKNSGQTPTNYFSKDAYDTMFEELWDELRDIELVDNSIEEIEQSEAFKFSPFKTLNADQEVAVQEILKVIDDTLKHPDNTTRPIVVRGMPGTGKTVLAIALLKTLKDLSLDDDEAHARYHDINVKLLEPVTGLRETIKRALKKTMNLSAADIIGPNDLAKEEYGHVQGKKGFDVVLIDEAHNLGLRKNMPPLQYKYYDGVTQELGLPNGAPQLDWVLDQVRVPIFFYDALQGIGPKGVGDALMQSRLGEAMEHPIELHSQMRVKGGIDYLDYVKAILFDEHPEPRAFDGYGFVLHDDFGEFEQCFEETLKSHALTRMVAGYAWPWTTMKGKSKGAFDIELDGVRKRWNRTFRDWVGKGLGDAAIAREVGCIHSIQGYDLSHAFVIIGNDLRYDKKKQRLYVDKSSYFDANGKRGASEAELNRYIRNIYYVLLTRGVEATHVYVCDEGLRGLLSGLVAPYA